MSSLQQRLYDKTRSVLASPWLKWLAAPVIGAAVVSSVIGGGTLPPTVNLSAEPLYARGARAKPTLTLVLSVEFPTVGAQFLDADYTPANEYIGYFDANSCYTYNDAPTEALPSGKTVADYKRFDRIGDADRASPTVSLRTCDAGSGTGRGFSGNFMNWASSSAIDILRRGLSGGDRIVDTDNGLTVLQRAVLPSNFWNSGNFPSKKLKASLAAGAVPIDLLKTNAGTVYGGDLYVANCLNRMYFGTAAGGSCGAAGSNGNLGTASASQSQMGTVQSYPGAASTAISRFGGTQCAVEDLNSLRFPGYTAADPSANTTNCSFSGVKTVLYGIDSGAAPNNNGQAGWLIASVNNGTACSYNAFNNTDPAVGTYKRCYVREYNSATDPPLGAITPQPATSLNRDGFFYSRVRVCEATSAGLTDPRISLCLQYPNGSYKPVGNLQKYSDAVRVAAFGYINDNTTQRYGGVLRTPMKYVGAKVFDANFSLVSGKNPNMEWNEATGVLVGNPDSADEGRSGLINYLNQFGRSGAYKTYDPVSELYYEALRYLQGLPPSDAATTGMTTAMKDGFPVYTNWIDPLPPVSGMSDYSCVNNNIVGIGDVNTHYDKSIPGNTRNNGDTTPAANVAANLPDVMAWTNVVGNFESRANLGSQNVSDNAAYYVAGLAYWANTQDIRGTNWTDPTTSVDPVSKVSKQRPGMRVTTYFLDVNENGSQTKPSAHQNNQFFLAAKYGGFTDLTKTGNPFVVYNSTKTAIIPGNGYWESPPGSGETKNYFLSSSASDVLKALDNIFAAVATKSNSIAGSAVSSSQLTTTQDYIYQSQFDASDWSGDVTATAVSAAASGGAVSIGSSTSTPVPPWTSAAAVLALKSPSARKIYVGGGNSSTPAGSFLWGNDLPAYVQTALQGGGGGAAATDAAGAQLRLNYLRGDQSQEAMGVFRKRGKLIGDIVNSGIVFSGPPSTVTQGSAYGSFYKDNQNRKSALFVGANDGMLHAFDVATGDELFGYIPSWVVPKLSALTSPSYVHQSYVDATPVVADAKVGNAWKTVLVSGAGGGGQGVFALDVTNPDPSSGTAPFGAGKVMWEFTDVDDSDLGNVIGRPLIVPMRVDSSGKTTYFAVVASGVNNYANDGHASTNGSAALFLLDLSKSTTDGWKLNNNYYKVTFPAPSASIASGMANVTARFDSTGVVSAMYAGDLQGNLWKLDFTKAAAGVGGWTMDKLSGFVDSSAHAVPLYIASDEAANQPSLQPITMAPSLLNGPNGTILVAFGTGKFLEVADISGSYKTQSVYAVLDNGAATLDTVNGAATNPSRAIAGRGRLQAGTLSGGTVSIADFTYGRPASDNDSGGVRAGWYFDFSGSSGSGERQISNFQAVASSLIFGSVIPSVSSCAGGSGKLYTIDILTGNGTSQVSTVGINGQPITIPVADSSLVLPATDSTGQSVRTIWMQTISQGSDGTATSTSAKVRQTVGRLSWREINNYQALK